MNTAPRLSARIGWRRHGKGFGTELPKIFRNIGVELVTGCPNSGADRRFQRVLLRPGFDRQALLSQPTQGWSREEVTDWIRQKSITAEALSELSELNGYDLLALKEEELLKIPGG